MTKQLQIFGVFFACLAVCVLNAQVPGTGRVQIKLSQSYSGTPLTKPSAIVVYNFAATPEEVDLNKSALNRVRMRFSSAQDDEKTKRRAPAARPRTGTPSGAPADGASTAGAGAAARPGRRPDDDRRTGGRPRARTSRAPRRARRAARHWDPP